jgi:hypothetical protein
VHEQVPDDWFVGFQVGLKAKFWRAASEPWAEDFDAVVCWGNSFGYMSHGDTRARNEYDAERCRLVGDFTFEDAYGSFERAGVIHHVHTVGEVVRLLEQAGFRVDELLSDPAERTPYAVGAPHLVAIVTAVKDLARP